MAERTVTNRVGKIIGCVAALAAVAGGIAILRAHAPTDSSYYPKCMLFQWTGLHCAGCGTTRALAALAHGRLIEAIRFNPLLILGGPWILAVILAQRHRERRGAKARPGLIWCLLSILVLYTLARNLPSPTRSILAPPAAPAEQNSDGVVRAGKNISSAGPIEVDTGNENWLFPHQTRFAALRPD
jgi:4-amino-4-deoxy-L-arabinose transferase-like glycosyltransferase